MKKESGITLVALIITIIVLLILSVVSINLVINSGIITKTKSAVDKYSEEEICEQIKLAYSEWQLSQYSGTTEDASTFIQNKLNSLYEPGTVTKVEEDDGIFTVYFSNGKEYTYNISIGKSEYIKPISEYPEIAAGDEAKENSRYISDGKTAVIPAGYTISDKSDEQSIDNGLVISKSGNEWVWIPVNSSDLALMYTEDATGWTMDGTEVVTKYKSNSRTDIDTSLTRVNPGVTTSYREPDMLKGSISQYDTVQINLDNAGFTSYTNMAISLRNDYKEMIKSIKKYGGFFVGKYEFAPKDTWYTAYKKCKALGTDSAESRMIWGCCWDQVCSFISNSGDKVNLNDSTLYGNYNNSPDSTKEVIQSGSNSKYKANNIFDLAGNCWEWTQEVNNVFYRATRGGSYNYDGNTNPVTFRKSEQPSQTFSNVATRSILYLN